ncbi:DUF4357 domain-containing protein [Oceanobacillus oncorhynchi]|uniref:DUF4357 domain-containing protein n=1 Tax=Oceanobacillus oncorhynchi TaxID=545501 RepID=UPI0025A3F0AA|nr:DUF4357 domain-containing protein [Oceanobacillus oncorhynchi]MDM8101255.1 DUF4357 domain-containing protein [Oceanobacillus oncorhynchi]
MKSKTVYGMKWKQFKARAIDTGASQIAVLSGSDMSGEVFDSLSDTNTKSRGKLISEGVVIETEEGNYQFLVDHIFNSPSKAASILKGHNESGPRVFGKIDLAA